MGKVEFRCSWRSWRLPLRRFSCVFVNCVSSSSIYIYTCLRGQPLPLFWMRGRASLGGSRGQDTRSHLVGQRRSHNTRQVRRHTLATSPASATMHKEFRPSLLVAARLRACQASLKKSMQSLVIPFFFYFSARTVTAGHQNVPT